MEDANGELRKLAIFNRFAEVGECLFLGFHNILDNVKYSLNGRPLEIITSLVPQVTGQETKNGTVLRGKFEAEGNRIYDDKFKFIGGLTHEARNLLHQAVHSLPVYEKNSATPESID